MAKANKQRDRVFLFGAMCAGILCCVTRADPLDTHLASVAAGVGAHSDHAVLPPRIIQAPLTDRTPEFTLRDVTALDFGSMWCVLDDDGENLVVTTESSGRIYGALYNLNHERLTEPVELAGPADTGDKGIADHKWLYQGGHHYLTFSISGDGTGGDLYLARFDTDLERTGFVQILSDAAPTNDMFFVGDGETVSVGKFLPGTGHEVHQFDEDLNWIDTLVIGGGINRHANGASAVFVDDHYNLVAPGTLAPGMNDSVYRIIYDQNWDVVAPRKEIIHDPGMITLVTGLSYEPGSDTFVVHYTRDPGDGGGNIWRAVFDEDWASIKSELALEGEFTRPHSVISGDLLFLGYEDGSGFTLGLTSWDISPGFPCENGDIDCDGDVDFADFSVLAGNFTGTITPPERQGTGGKTRDDGDFDGDGDVDFGDFSVLSGSFTGTITAPAGDAPTEGDVHLAIDLTNDGAMTLEPNNADLAGYSIRSPDSQLVLDSDGVAAPFLFYLLNAHHEVTAGSVGTTTMLTEDLALDISFAGDADQAANVVFQYTRAGDVTPVDGTAHVIPEPAILIIVLGLGLFQRRRQG